jgi:para-aminobenzoate synthetase component I
MQNIKIELLSEIDTQKMLYTIGEQTNIGNQNLANFSPPPLLYFQKSPIHFSAYLPKFERIIAYIKRGDSYLVNLTAPTPIQTNLSLQDIFFASKARYKIWLKDHLVFFSPEIFIQIIDNQIFTFPMKGTINADLPNAAQVILADEKEKAEHATIVDLLRNDLSMVAENVRVNRFRYVEKIHTHDRDLLQVSSEIVGNLPTHFYENIGDLLFSLLPAGSICGAPKKKTVEIILEIEQYTRGYYTGICGIFDGKNLDSGVMIRFIEQTGNGLVFKSGGGITAQSQAQAEYEEMINKVYVPIVRND